MSKTFFTADTHFGHDAVIKFCNRPWDNTAIMDRALIRNWNEVVSDEDTVYILGDFIWAEPTKLNMVKKITQKLNGKKILIYGNHDILSPFQYANCGLHQVVYPYAQVLDCYLLHDPSLAVACPKDSIILSGHVHNLYGRINKGPMDKIVVDVGVDGWDYHPVEYSKILEEIELWKTKVK